VLLYKNIGIKFRRVMLKTIQGIYRNGNIELAETPQGITESQVFVTFLPNQPAQKTMAFGMFTGVRESTEADFKDAEFKDNDDPLNLA
jgi:hypothetical protein